MFVMALEETDLLDALDSRGPFTVFAPTNRAFSQLPNYVFKTLLSDTRRLRKIVLNHALGGEMYTDEMQDGDELETLHDLYLEVDDLGYAIAVDGAQIVEADLEARNGVLDAIDGVLLPCLACVDTGSPRRRGYDVDHPAASAEDSLDRAGQS